MKIRPNNSFPECFGDIAIFASVVLSRSVMSFLINFRGGTLLVMMGQQTRSESLFYYFRLEDHIPADHLLRLVDHHIEFAFVRETL